MPSILLTDQGRNFESHLFASICKLFGIEKRRTTPYHPQTDGLCERFNGVLKALLRMKVSNDKDDWDEQLPHALLAYRVSKQSSTGATPFELLYGRPRRQITIRYRDRGSTTKANARSCEIFTRFKEEAR